MVGATGGEGERWDGGGWRLAGGWAPDSTALTMLQERETLLAELRLPCSGVETQWLQVTVHPPTRPAKYLHCAE